MVKKIGKLHKPSSLGKIICHIPYAEKWFYPYRQAMKLTVREEERTFPGLPEELDGKKLVFLSDIHCGVYYGKPRAAELAARVRAEKADLILMGGDYGEDSAAAEEFWNMLEEPFQAPMGVYAVLGNHDVTEPERIPVIRDIMEKKGVRLLVNEEASLPGGAVIFGLGEYYHEGADLKKTVELFRNPGFHVLLTHTPDVLPEIYETDPDNRIDLCFCGHTHGGQIAIGGWAPRSSSLYKSRYLSGWKKENGTEILISMGVGTSFLPVRMGTKSEYHAIRLRRG